jgi:transposase-like protein
MAAKRRQCTAECKQDAIRLGPEQGDGVSASARHLGLKAPLWGGWKRDVDPTGRAAFAGNGRLASAPAAWRR